MSRAKELCNFTGTIAELEDFLTSIIRKSWLTGSHLIGEERVVLLRLYAADHPTIESQPISIRGEENANRTGAHAVYAFDDGREEIVSVKKMRRRIDNPCPAAIGMRRLQEALRFTIRPQSNEVRFRARTAIINGVLGVCPLSGISLEKQDEIEVHHAGVGKDFVNLVASWAKSEGLRGRDVKVTSAPNGEGTIMADVAQRKSWYQFHALHAQLVAVDREAHRKLSKGRLNLDW